MSSITTWARLEPRVRTTSLSSVDARVYDPLWLLGRQWQVGEFAGEDAGSPVRAHIQAEHSRLSRFAPRDGNPRPYNPLEDPLDLEVEREQPHVAGPDPLRLSAELGAAFLRQLDTLALAKLKKGYLKRFPLEAPDEEAAPLDPESRRLATVVAGRVPDGLAMLKELRGEKRTRKALDDVSALRKLPERERERAAISRWRRLAGQLGATAQPETESWDDSRLEYRFAASARLADGEVSLRADEYQGGGIDWDSFDLDPDLELGAKGVPTTIERTTMPAPVAYRGMPLPRWWEFEHARVHFGAVEAAPEDVGRMLLMEFALLYGNDHFVIPLELPLGSVCRIETLEVTDSFGLSTVVPSAAEADGSTKDWRMFALSSTKGGSQPLLVLAPGAGDALAGPPLEEVHLLRDEAANMAWGVERTVEGPDGRPLARFEEWQRKRSAEAAAAEAAGKPPVPPTTAPLRYRISTPPPDYWLPLVPVTDGSGKLRLELRTLLDESSPPQPIPPQGRVLFPGQLIYEEEVPREGKAVVRRWRHARWLGGRALLWQHRLSRPGRGEGSSNLRFDVAEPDAGP
jgi:hypothetical protein